MAGVRPTSLRPGDRIVNTTTPRPIAWTFVRRVRGQPGRPAHSVLQSDECRGLSGPDDQGFATATDYAVSRHFARVSS